MRKLLATLIPVSCLFLALSLSSCGGDGEPSTREKLIGSWLINNAGALQPYVELKPHLATLPVKNSIMEILDDGTVIGTIHQIKQTYEGTDTLIVLRSWKGTWSLSKDNNYLNIKGISDTSTVQHPISRQKREIVTVFDNPLFIEFKDEQTLILTSQEIPFLFKKI